jgi:pimeloyl-ACP methyl ester carboxylesterase
LQSLVASKVTAFTVPNASHWLVQENPQEVVEGLLSFPAD